MNINIKSILKWVPVIIAGGVAVVQAISEQKEAERIDDMEERLIKLENHENNDEEEES